MDDDRRSYTSAGSGSNKSAISAPTTFSSARPVNYKDYIRIKCKKIEIKPTGAHLDTYTDGMLAVLFRYTTHDICLCLNGLKDKVCIPYDQVTGFRITEYKELEISLVPNFNRKEIEIREVDAEVKRDIEVKGDPSNGLLEKATSLIFICQSTVSLNSLVAVEEKIGKYRSEMVSTKNNNLVNNPVLISNIQDDTANSNKEMYVRFFLYVERGGVIVPQDISFSGIIQSIASKFRFHLNYDRVYYKNGVSDMVAIRDEEDWRVAKWEARHSNNSGMLNLYLGGS